MTRRTLFAALLAPFAPKLKFPSPTCVGSIQFNGIPMIIPGAMRTNEIMYFASPRGLFYLPGAADRKGQTLERIGFPYPRNAVFLKNVGDRP